MKKTLFFLTLLAAASIQAGTIRFRHGEIVAAEITAADVRIGNFDRHAFPALPNNRMYAVLSVKLDANRKISIFDFMLEAFGATSPCVAINPGSGFRYTTDTISGRRQVQLLFILEKRSLQNREILKLKCALSPHDGSYDVNVPFRDRGTAQPTTPDAIPAAGSFEDNGK